MRIAVMQPYFFPYIGYFQLISAVDRFVLFDDVNYINGGWINRNRILLDGSPAWLTLPLVKSSQNRMIAEHEVLNDRRKLDKLVRTLNYAYQGAPCYESVIQPLATLMQSARGNLVDFLESSLSMVIPMLGIDVQMSRSSELDLPKSLRGEDRVLAICRKLGATTYINLPGGRELYSSGKFAGEGIELRFIESAQVRYTQFRDEFVANLSIIDMLMFNRLERRQQLLQHYALH